MLSTKQILKLSAVILIGGVLLFYFFSLNPEEESNLYIPCPSKTFLGINCPACGTQRMFHHLLHLDILQAFRYNPLMLLFIPVIAYALFIQLYHFIFDVRIESKLLNNNKFLLILVVILILFGIFRNIPYYPFTLLAPPG